MCFLYFCTILPARHRLVMRLTGLILCTLAILNMHPARSDTPPLLIFAAASLKETFEDIGQRYQAQGGARVIFSFASSSILAKQIEAGAPADLFISADLKWMDVLEEKKLIRPETRINLLGNRLVVIAPRQSLLARMELTPDAFANALGDGKLAIGDVTAVPAGLYARAALTSLGLWTIAEPHLAPSDNVRGALAFVARNEAPLGIVYKTDALVESKVKIVAEFPQQSHEPIVYPIALTNSTSHQDAASFLDYLRSAEAQSIFERAGFVVLAH